jgi:Cohesin domain
MAMVLTVVVGLLSYSSHLIVHATWPPMIAVNGPASACMSQGAIFTTTVTASNLTNTYAWQLNLTFTGITLVNYTVGSLFWNAYLGGTGVIGSDKGPGYFLFGFSFYGGGSPVTTTSQAILVTLTWQSTLFQGPIRIHVGTLAEDPYFGTELLDRFQNSQVYTTKGYSGCGSPTVAMPDMSGHCLNTGATVTTALTVSNTTGIHAWEANVTFDAPGIISLKSYAMGTAFTGSNTQYSNITSNAKGWFLLNFTYTNTATYTASSQVTLATITWKTLVYHATVSWHIVLSAENTPRGTYLWGTTHQQSQPYTTSDGFLGCQA